MVYGGATSLHSINASGQINKEYVYYVVKGVQRRRGYFIPSNPQTPRQQSRRAFFKNGMQYWGNLPEIEKQEYNKKAKIIKIGWIGYNYFMQLWMRGDIVMDCIKSIQRGTLECVNGDNDVTISEVDMNKTMVLIPCYLENMGGTPPDTAGIVAGNLLNSTTIRIKAVKIGTGVAPISSWQVIEYY